MNKSQLKHFAKEVKEVGIQLWPVWLAYILIVLMAVSIAGCASEPLTLEQEYEKENKRVLRREEMAAFINGCRANPTAVLYYNKLNRSDQLRIDRAIRRKNYVTADDMPRVAFGLDVRCVRLNHH